MSTAIESPDGREIDIEEAEADFVAVPRNEWGQQTARINELESAVSDLRDELAEYKQFDGKRHAKTNQRISEVGEDDSEDEKGGVEADNDGSPLMQIVQLPHETAERECTNNVRRARFIANSVVEYADKCPAGFVLSSKAVRRVLNAADETNGTPHSQTIARVQQHLSKLGGDGVEVRKRHGKKIVVFEKELAKQLSDVDHTRCDGQRGSTVPSNVIGVS